MDKILVLRPSSLQSYCGGNTYYVSASNHEETIASSTIAANGLSIVTANLLDILVQYNENENIEFYKFHDYGAAIKRQDEVNPPDDSSVFDDLEETKDLMEKASKLTSEFSFNLSVFRKVLAPESLHSFGLSPPQNSLSLNTYVPYIFTGASPISITRNIGEYTDTPDISTRFLYLLYKYSSCYDIVKEQPWRPPVPHQPIRKIDRDTVASCINPYLHSNCDLLSNEHTERWSYMYITALPPLYNRVHQYRSWCAIISFDDPILVGRYGE